MSVQAAHRACGACLFTLLLEHPDSAHSVAAFFPQQVAHNCHDMPRHADAPRPAHHPEGHQPSFLHPGWNVQEYGQVQTILYDV